MIPPLAVGIAYVVSLFRRRDRWSELTQRGGWRWEFSRLDVLFYGYTLMTMIYLVGVAILRTSENTKRMGEVVEQMNASSEQSVLVLAAMRDEADAARRETAAAQRLAIWVGVATAIVGALLGGIAGAFAAKMIGSS